MEKDNPIQSEDLIEEFDLLDDIPTLTSLADKKNTLHSYDSNCTCINCCAHRVIEASIQKNDKPRITSTKTSQDKKLSKQDGNDQTKKPYGSGIRMDNVTFTSAWDDWEIDS
jgi:hypothetical protein